MNESCHTYRSKRLEVELTEERRKGSEALSKVEHDDKSALQGKIEMRMSKTDQDASTGDGDRKDPKILLLQLEEANGKVSDMQMRLDILFEKNMAVEKRAREAELERKRAAEEQDSYKDKSNSLQREQNEAQQQIVELESVINMLQRTQCTSEREISGYHTGVHCGCECLRLRLRAPTSAHAHTCVCVRAPTSAYAHARRRMLMRMHMRMHCGCACACTCI